MWWTGNANFAMLLYKGNGSDSILESPSPHPLPFGERRKVRGRNLYGGLTWIFSI
jgi:hypothetical protein